MINNAISWIPSKVRSKNNKPYQIHTLIRTHKPREVKTYNYEEAIEKMKNEPYASMRPRKTKDTAFFIMDGVLMSTRQIEGLWWSDPHPVPNVPKEFQSVEWVGFSDK